MDNVINDVVTRFHLFALPHFWGSARRVGAVGTAPRVAGCWRHSGRYFPHEASTVCAICAPIVRDITGQRSTSLDHSSRLAQLYAYAFASHQPASSCSRRTCSVPAAEMHAGPDAHRRRRWIAVRGHAEYPGERGALILAQLTDADGRPESLVIRHLEGRTRSSPATKAGASALAHPPAPAAPARRPFTPRVDLA